MRGQAGSFFCNSGQIVQIRAGNGGQYVLRVSGVGCETNLFWREKQ